MWKTRLLIVVLAAASAWGWGRASQTEPAVRRAQQREARWSLSRASQAFPALLRIAKDELRMRVHAASADPALRAARQSQQAAQLFVRSLPKDGTDEDWMILSKDGMVIARSGNAAKRGASLLGELPVRTIVAGTPWSGLYRFEDSWRLMSGTPVRGSLGVEGAVLVLRRLDGELAHELAEGAGAELAFVDGDRILGTVPSAALADLRQRPWDGAAAGAIDEVHAGGSGWHVVTVGHNGPAELEFLLLRQRLLGDDPLAELGIRDAEAWLQPGPVGIILVFAALGLFGLWLAGSEGRARRVYKVQTTTPAPLPPSAFLPDLSSDGQRSDDAELPPPLLEEAMLNDEWSHNLKSAVDSLFAEAAPEPDAEQEQEPTPQTVPDKELVPEPEPGTEAEPEPGTEAETEPATAETTDPEKALNEFETRTVVVPPEIDAGWGGPGDAGADEEERENTARWGSPVAGSPSAADMPSVAASPERGSLNVEWSGRYETPTPLDKALGTPAPEPMAEDPRRKYEQLYVRFLQCRQACGESTEDISYERFERRLDRNAMKVRERYDCDDVRFNIRIVDGRAKVKAMPVDSRSSA